MALNWIFETANLVDVNVKYHHRVNLHFQRKKKNITKKLFIKLKRKLSMNVIIKVLAINQKTVKIKIFLRKSPRRRVAF